MGRHSTRYPAEVRERAARGRQNPPGHKPRDRGGRSRASRLLRNPRGAHRVPHRGQGRRQPVAPAARAAHPALLAVDEIGYLPVNQDGAALFFQLIDARHEKASTVLTSNKGFEDWGGMLGDEVMAAALIDRLVHHCHIVNIRGNSCRMKDRRNLLQSGADRRRKSAAA